MATNINLIAFGTFGNPNGFKQTFFIGNKELSKAVKTFDLNTNAIKLFANSKLYSIRKEYVSGYNTIAYSLYTYAKEQNSDRSGTFIGSSILYVNKIAEEQITVNQLNEFHEYLIQKNVSNDAISVNHSDNLTVLKPKDFDKIQFNLRPLENVDFSMTTNKSLVVFCKTTNEFLSQFFKKSIDLLNVYDTIFFTESREIAEFVNQKGIFKLIQNVGEQKGIDQEVMEYVDERTRKKELYIFEFEKEFQKLEDDKIRILNEFNLQIGQNEKTHRENEILINESKNNLKKIEQIYHDFSTKISELVNQLKYGKKIEDVNLIHNENKKRFIEGVNQIKKPEYINKLPKASAKSGLHVFDQDQLPDFKGKFAASGNEKQQGYKFDMYKFYTVILMVLLLLTWVVIIFKYN